MVLSFPQCQTWRLVMELDGNFFWYFLEKPKHSGSAINTWNSYSMGAKIRSWKAPFTQENAKRVARILCYPECLHIWVTVQSVVPPRDTELSQCQCHTTLRAGPWVRSRNMTLLSAPWKAGHIALNSHFKRPWVSFTKPRVDVCCFLICFLNDSVAHCLPTLV